MAGKKDIVEQALKLIAGGAKEAGPSVAERAAKNIDVFNTANRLGVDTNDIAKLQETKRLMDYHKGFMGDVKERAKSANEIVQQMKASGAFPMEIGTRYTTEHSRRTGQGPWTVTNYYVDPKNPQGSYGYYVRRELPDGGYEESISKIRDPKLEAMHGPEKWEELQRGFIPMTGPKVVKASGGSIREGYGPGGWVDDVVKMAGKVISGEGEEATKAFRMPRVRPSTDNIHDVGSANFDYYDVVGNKTMPIKDVFGGVDLSMPDQRARVDALKAAMSDPEKGYISRIIVDDEGNVIEGQHRFDAFRELGASEIPVTMLRDRSRGVDVGALKSAIQQQGGIHPDQTSQIVDMILEGNPEDYEPPQGFEKWWNAGVNEYNKQRGRIAKGGGGGFLDDALRMAGKAIFGEGEDAAKAGIRAYQGSPHNFAAERLVRFPTGKEEYLVGQPDVLPDVPEGAEVVQDFPLGRMRMDKIGTGEGAQAYGHGLYAAESEPTAKYYRDALSRDVSYGGQPVAKSHPMDNPEAGAIHSVASRVAEGMAPEEAIAEQAAIWKNYAEQMASFSKGKPELEKLLPERTKSFYEIANTIEQLDPALFKKNPGHMYEVNIAANPEQFLDWDKPLSEQSEAVKNAFRSMDIADESVWPNITANDAYEMLRVDSMGDDAFLRDQAYRLARRAEAGAGASRMLREAGIPGIKYLDAGSRGAGDGTRNYVVFDDKLISIVRKYGIAGASAMLGYNLMEQLDPKQALAASMADQDYQASRPQRSMGGNNSISGALNVARGLNGVK